ncbi:glycosyltransferase [Eilatimonas milleporae]|uniref:GT2 family glycosyltransferase n=1 Tax=Eilatimonas milleporae TaxID=911205 RepID=A0A3M0CT46_9PROT|nr:glycosyltransferase [Eilatimonas milleporae]RMB12638.1 GT2 family glycosyltransferase [Eilatimonas milleporae]
MIKISVVVPIYNALDQVRECIESLVQHRHGNVELIIVNDGSDLNAKAWLTERLAKEDNCTLIHNEENIGYLKSVNKGFSKTSGDIIVSQNSDTIIFSDFFEKITGIFDAHKDVGIINPVSTWANWTRIPFPAGHNIYSLQSYIDQTYGREIVDINCASGFSFAFRREVYEQLGGFDPIYDPGYWEETDYCLKALDAGWRVVCAMGLYVFHHGWSSFGEEMRNAHMHVNGQIFRSRWLERFDELEREWTANDPLRAMRHDLETLEHGPNKNIYNKDDKSLSVLYIVPDMPLYGGIISILQVVNRLVLEGVRANVAIVSGKRTDALRYAASYFSPLQFESEADLLASGPQADLYIATAWDTAYTVKKAHARGLCKDTAYFVQDYEPDFHPDDPVQSIKAEVSYDLVQNRIVKTEWLKKKLEKFGGETRIIPLGLNTDIFADYGRSRSPMLVSMARPSSPRRNWTVTRKVFQFLSEHWPDLNLGIYGFGFDHGELPPNIQNFGVLNSAKDVANMLNDATMLLDASIYQGFGRPGLEAIACGVVPILTKYGGITSYAVHEENCLLIDPMDVSGIVAAIIRLLGDPDLMATLKENGKQVKQKYTLKNEGYMTKVFFEEIIDSRQY